MVDTPELQVVGAIIARRGSVQIKVRRIGKRCAPRSRTRSIVFVVERVRPGIDQAKLRQVPCIACQLRLQSIIVRTKEGLVHRNTAGVVASETGGRVTVGYIDRLVGVE